MPGRWNSLGVQKKLAELRELESNAGSGIKSPGIMYDFYYQGQWMESCLQNMDKLKFN